MDWSRLVAGLGFAWLFVTAHSGQVTLHVLGETNIDSSFYRMVVVSNSTRKTHAFLAFAVPDNDPSVRLGRPVERRDLMVDPGGSITFRLPVTTNGPVTVTIIDSVHMESWERRLRAVGA